MRFNVWSIISAFLFLLLVVSLFSGGFGIRNYLPQESKDEIAKRAIDFINKNLLSGEAKASLVSVSLDKNGLYKIKFKVGEQEIESYISGDGKILFPQAINLEEIPEAAQKPQTEQEKLTCDDIKKNDKPLLEAFVVSECPFGIQMQRILSEIVKNIPSLAFNIKVKYMGSLEQDKIISMHGDEEAKENLRQMCIREEQQGKFWDYIACHIKKGDVENCLAEAGVDTKLLDSCMKNKSKGLAYAKKDFEAQEKYKVTGSPTLILNGIKIDERAFSNGMNLNMRSAEMVETLLCCAFKARPKDCSKKLNENPAATSFSEEYSGSSGTGGYK